FHERHLQADLALALLRRLQKSSRPDLKLVAMSATLDAAPVAHFLDACPTLRSAGRRFDVEIEHLARPDERPLAAQVATAVRQLTASELAGNVLVFLPGAAEIRRAQAACAELAAQHDLLVLPLHGELPAAEQDRVVRPAEQRKLILSTNVAESSVTIDGVVAVVDSGLARTASHSPWSGLPTLQVGRISQASATQRAGRAGRTRPGRCLRLYTAQDYAARPAYDAPEIQRLDLADAALELHAAGIDDLTDFAWFEAPPAPALVAADALLAQLGALDAAGRVSEIGWRMLQLPLHPRLARVLVEAGARGVGAAGCLVAALISERDIRTPQLFDARTRTDAQAKTHGASDLLELYDLFIAAERARFAPARLHALGLEPGAVRAVERVRQQLERTITATSNDRARAPGRSAKRVDGALLTDEEESALLVSILAGYPDRVARRRERAGDVELLLAQGGSALLAPESIVRAAEFLVAVEAEERRAPGRAGGRGGQTRVRLASAIEPDWLLDLFPAGVRETTELTWNAQTERVEGVSRLLYGQLALTESRAGEAANEEAAQVLAAAARAAGWRAFGEAEPVERLLARVEFMARTFPEAGFPALDEPDVNASLAQLCAGRRSFAELRAGVRGGELLAELRRRLTQEQARLLAAMAPERVQLAGGRQVRVNYERARTPWIASRLQDFFRMREGPRVAGGRVALVLHLLAPSQRPLQVT
ncbi:MAG TPA: ATP-dependent helicase C-terminal domain-containing protein, partial [Pyrinomonadaceae bacterium]|nr:ATP-dependent helicase C-terminal domain-containing protein [Pyrinomonadaceae bacterium]